MVLVDQPTGVPPIGGVHCACGSQVPLPPVIDWPFWQQTRPSSQAPCTPPLQEHPWPVQGEGAQFASAVQVPGPPGTDCPLWQQTRPLSQAFCTPPLQAQPSVVHG